MLMMAQPIYDCFMKVCDQAQAKPHLIYMSPCGKTLTQERVKELAEIPNIAILCGRYEGVDQRLIDEIVDEEISIGDFVLTGGELPALAVADAVCRMLPGVLSEDICFEEESHFDGLLEFPQYTRPAVWHEREVPEVLLSGNHAKINDWRRAESILVTLNKRPDMLKYDQLSEKDKKILKKHAENAK
jgi:tRNA (guanine37-N1)-methyltransferase